MPQTSVKEGSAPGALVITCDICCIETSPFDLLRPCSCGARYCPSCLKERFIMASNDASLMPPSCCDGVIPIHFVIIHMSAAEIALYQAKFDEWRSPVKMYCPVPWCSTFISDRLLSQGHSHVSSPSLSKKNKSIKSQSTSNEQKSVSLTSSQLLSSHLENNPSSVDCPNCRARICVNCKQLCHPGSPCGDLIEKKTRDVISKLGYKTCPACGHGVRRMYGCNHMACVCGAHFCWGCRRPIGQCEETEDCLDEEDTDCAEDPDPEAERLGVLNDVMQEFSSSEPEERTYHELCQSLIDDLTNSDLFADLSDRPIQRQRELLDALEMIPTAAARQRSNQVFEEGRSILVVLGRLARRCPDSAELSDEDAVHALITLVRKGIPDLADRNREPARSQEELVDLDDRDAAERDLDLGEEPTDPERSFEPCKHRFVPYKTPLVNKQHGPVATDKMKCHRCWENVRPQGGEPAAPVMFRKGVRYSLRSMSKAAESQKEGPSVGALAWSCATCRIMFCADCVEAVGGNLSVE